MSEYKFFRVWQVPKLPRLIVISIREKHQPGFEISRQVLDEFLNIIGMNRQKGVLIKLPQNVDADVGPALQSAAQDQPPQGLAFYSYKKGGYRIIWRRNGKKLQLDGWRKNRWKIIYI